MGVDLAMLRRAQEEKSEYTLQSGDPHMTTRHTCAYLLMVSGMLLFPGCSAWGPNSREGPQFESGTFDGQRKSLAGVYRDIGADGSIKAHPEFRGTEGQADGLIQIGGAADIPNIKKGTMETKGSMGTSKPTMRMGEKTFPSGPQ